jgi:hypothetical protein
VKTEKVEDAGSAIVVRAVIVDQLAGRQVGFSFHIVTAYTDDSAEPFGPIGLMSPEEVGDVAGFGDADCALTEEIADR